MASTDPASSAAKFDFPRGLRRIRESWAQTFKLGRHWRLDVEWGPKARSFDFWFYDARRNDGS